MVCKICRSWKNAALEHHLFRPSCRPALVYSIMNFTASDKAETSSDNKWARRSVKYEESQMTYPVWPQRMLVALGAEEVRLHDGLVTDAIIRNAVLECTHWTIWRGVFTKKTRCNPSCSDFRCSQSNKPGCVVLYIVSCMPRARNLWTWCGRHGYLQSKRQADLGLVDVVTVNIICYVSEWTSCWDVRVIRSEGFSR
jgi:hypothetical protein